MPHAPQHSMIHELLLMFRHYKSRKKQKFQLNFTLRARMSDALSESGQVGVDCTLERGCCTQLCIKRTNVALNRTTSLR